MTTTPSKPTSPPRTDSTTTTRRSAGAALERLMPQDIDAERALLGAMLLEDKVTGDVIEVLRDVGAEAFAREAHQHLYDVLVGLYDTNQPFDSVVIREQLLRRGHEKLASNEFLAGFLGAVPSALRARHYAGIVHEKCLLRQLIAATDRVLQAAFDNDQPAREILDFAEKQVFDVTERRISGEAQLLPELVWEAFKKIEGRGEGSLTGLPTGFVELDELTCGLQRGELIIIAGRPSMGKTAFGLNVAEHLAIHEKKPVLFFSLEMSRQQLAQRILCSQARVDSHRLRRGRHSGRDLEDLKHAADAISNAPLLVDDTSDLTILELRARARMAYRRYRVEAVFVDYLQLMRIPKAESRQIEVATISRGLKALAKDLSIPVVAMAQLNRNPEDKARRGNRPRMSDLRESGAIEQDADVIALLHREPYFKEQPGTSDDDAAPGEPSDNTAELIIAKQRNGPIGNVNLHWNNQFTRFDNHLPDTGDRNYAPSGGDDAPF